MSVDRTDFIVHGWKLPYKFNDIDVWADHLEDYLGGNEKVKYQIIGDGMSGAYMVFGKVISVSSDEGWDFIFLNDISCDVNDMKKVFKTIFKIKPPKEPQTFIF
jgi:hypothetical protein